MGDSKIVHISAILEDRGLKVTGNVGQVILDKLSAFSMPWMKSSLRLDLIPEVRRKKISPIPLTFVQFRQKLAALM